MARLNIAAALVFASLAFVIVCSALIPGPTVLWFVLPGCAVFATAATYITYPLGPPP